MGGAPGSGEARETHGAGLPGAVVPFGRGRGRATETGAPAGTATSEATRRRSEPAGDRPHKRPCGGARRLGAADGGRSMTATRADVERAVSGRPGRGPRNGRVWDGDVRARSRRWFNAGVPDDEIPGLQRGLRRIGASEHQVLRPGRTHTQPRGGRHAPRATGRGPADLARAEVFTLSSGGPGRRLVKEAAGARQAPSASGEPGRRR